VWDNTQEERELYEEEDLYSKKILYVRAIQNIRESHVHTLYYKTQYSRVCVVRIRHGDHYLVCFVVITNSYRYTRNGSKKKKKKKKEKLICICDCNNMLRLYYICICVSEFFSPILR